MMTRLDNTIARLNQWFVMFDQPVIASSFGKDSMVMIFIIFRLMEKKLPVIYHGQPWNPWKNDFANGIIKAYNIEVYDYPPLMSGIKVKPDRLEIVNRYQMGQEPQQTVDMPVNVLPWESEDVLCGIKVLARPKGGIFYQWDLTLVGHKDCDVDQFEGHMPLQSDLVQRNGMPALGFPLKDWSDEELWEFIEKRRVPVQYGTRYVDRKEIENKDFNNDYIACCTNCIDPRNPAKVMCPLVNHSIDNVSAGVVKFKGRPSYIVEKKDE